MKELENMNKKLKEENNNLNDEIIKLKKEIVEHAYCENKRNTLLEQIKYLTEENKRFKIDIKRLATINEELLNTNNKYKYLIKKNNINLDDTLSNNGNTKDNNNSVTNLKKIYRNNNSLCLILKSPRLPNIKKLKNHYWKQKIIN